MKGWSLFYGWRKADDLISMSFTLTMQTIIQKASSSFRKSSRVAAIMPMPCKVALQLSTRGVTMRKMIRMTLTMMRMTLTMIGMTLTMIRMILTMIRMTWQ